MNGSACSRRRLTSPTRLRSACARSRTCRLRKPTFKAATLAFITGERVDVVVKNVSDTGARVEFLRDIQLPDRVLVSEPTMRLKTWAYVIWQTRGAAGLQFVKT
jgi:hypothetical protein